jgi:uncharacterized membrane protein
MFLHVSWAEPEIAFIKLLGLVAWIVSMVEAGRRKKFHLPIIGALADWLSRLYGAL